MRLRHLRYFVGIVDAGSISRAAATIGAALLPKADFSFDDTMLGVPPPRAVDPPMTLTSSIIWGDDISLGHAASSVRDVLADFLVDHLGSNPGYGIEPVDQQAVTASSA